MGTLKVKRLANKSDFLEYSNQLLADIAALEQMLQEKRFEKEPIRIGAEQEFCLVDNDFEPANNAVEILKEINDDHFTTEITKYNLEINLDPIDLSEKCFSKMHNQLKTLLEKANKIAKKHQSKVLLAGILPTIKLRHLDESYMTPLERYYMLNDAIKESRKHIIEFHIKGVDELNILHDSVMFEGCNTSFQLHLQIPQEDFVSSFNWAQAISGPVLSVCTNSPILFGKELWSETRIALFTQSVDTRANSFTLNEKSSRVSFGTDWVTGSVANIFKNNIAQFRSLLMTEEKEDSLSLLKQNITPKLKALNLHNGTVYPWNRPCYGVANNKPHLRIENRYIPAGPSTTDEIANFMFWVGIMVGRPQEYDEIHLKMDFKDAKTNFFNAARYGMATQFYWDNKLIPSHQLLLDVLLPMAYKGLYKMKVTPEDVEYYLTIIENRIKTQTGSQWMVQSFRNLQHKNNKQIALRALTEHIYNNQEKGYPIATWPIARAASKEITKNKLKVEHCMSNLVYTVQEKDSLAMANALLTWKKIKHLPVLNTHGELVGILTKKDIEAHYKKNKSLAVSCNEVMSKKVIAVSREESVANALKIMKQHNINSLPVLYKNKLTGIITSTDL